MSTFVLDMSTFGLVFMMVIAKGKQCYRKLSMTGYMGFFIRRKVFCLFLGHISKHWCKMSLPNEEVGNISSQKLKFNSDD